MFNDLNNLIGATYHLATPKYKNAYEEGETLAWVTDQDGSILEAKLTIASASLPTGVSLDISTGEISRSAVSVQLEEGTYPLEIAIVNTSGGCTLHQIELVFLADTPSKVTYSSAANQRLEWFDEGSNAKPWIVCYFSEPNGEVVDLRLASDTQVLPSGFSLEQSAAQLRVDDEAVLQVGTFDLQFLVTDEYGEVTELLASFEIKPNNYVPAVVHDPYISFESLAINDKLLDISNDEDQGLATVSLATINGLGLDPADFGLVLEEYDGLDKKWHLRIGSDPADQVLFKEKIRGNNNIFSHDAGLGIYHYQLIVKTTDSRGFGEDVTTSIAVEQGPVATWSQEYIQALSTYRNNDVLLRFSIDKESISSIVETTDPDGNANVVTFSTLGLAFDVNDNYAIVIMDYNAFITQLPAFSNQVNGHYFFGAYVLSTDSLGGEQKHLIGLRIQEDLAPELRYEKVREGDFYNQGSLLATAVHSGGRAITTASITGNTADQLRDQLGLVLTVDQGMARINVATRTLFQDGILSGTWTLEKGIFSLQLTMNVTDSVAQNFTLSISLNVLQGDLGNGPEILYETCAYANEYADDTLLLTVSDVPNGGLLQFQLFSVSEPGPAVSPDLPIDLGGQLDPATLSLMGLKTVTAEGGVTLKVDESVIPFLNALDEHYPIVDGEHSLSLYIGTVNALGKQAHTQLNICVKEAISQAGNNVTVLPQQLEYLYKRNHIIAAIVHPNRKEFKSANVTGTNLDSIGLILLMENDGLLRLRVKNTSIFQASLLTHYTVFNDVFSKPITVVTVDEFDIERTDNLFFQVESSVHIDSASTLVTPQPGPVVDETNGLNLLVAEIQDVDGAIKNDGSAELRDAISKAPLTLSAMGLQLVVNGVTGNLEIQVSEMNQYRSHLTTNSYSVNILAYVEDEDGGDEEVPVTLSIRPDTEAQAIVITKHEGEYALQEEVITFMDLEGPLGGIASLSTDVNALDNIGLEISPSGKDIRIKNLQDFLDGLPTYSYNAGTNLYSLIINVTTSDGNGGLTDLAVNFEAQKDRETSCVVEIITTNGDHSDLLTFTDLDEWNTVPDITPNGTLPIGTEIAPGSSDKVAVLKVAGDIGNLEYFDGTLDFGFVDPKGGTTSLSIPLLIDVDRPSTMVDHGITSYGDNTVLITFTDLDGWDPRPNIVFSGGLPAGTQIVLGSEAIEAVLKVAGDASALAYYDQEVTVTTTDKDNGVTVHTFQFMIDVDQPAQIYGTIIAKKHEAQYSLNEEVVVIEDPDSDLLGPEGTNYQFRLTSGGGNADPMAMGMTSSLFDGRLVYKITNVSDFLNGIKDGAGPDKRTYYIWTKDIEGGETETPVLVEIVIDTPAAIDGAVITQQHEGLYDVGNLVVKVADSVDGGIPNNAANVALRDTSGGSNLTVSTLGMGLSVVSDKVELNITDTANFITAVKVGVQSDRRTWLLYTKDAAGGETETSFTVIIDPDVEAIIHFEQTPKEIDDYDTQDVLFTFKDADGDIDPNDCVLQDENGVPLVLGSHGMAFVQNSNNTDWVDLIVGVYPVALTDFLDSMVLSRDYKVETEDEYGGTTTHDITITMLPNNSSLQVFEFDGDYYASYAAGHDFVRFSDANNVTQLSVLEYTTAQLSETFSLGLLVDSGLGYLRIEDTTAFVANIVNWDVDEQVHYELTLTFSVTDGLGYDYVEVVNIMLLANAPR